jgi:hypothetical protein
MVAPPLRSWQGWVTRHRFCAGCPFNRVLCEWGRDAACYTSLPLGPSIRPFLPTRRVKMLSPAPNVHASHLTCDNQKVLHLLILLLLAE